MFKKHTFTAAILSSLSINSFATGVDARWDVSLEDNYNTPPGSLITGISGNLNVLTGYTGEGKDAINFVAWISADGSWFKKEFSSEEKINGVSGDGNLIYGKKYDNEGNYRAFTAFRNRNDEFSLLQDMGTFYRKKDGSYIGNSEIKATSYNGEVIIGSASSFEGIKSGSDKNPEPSEHAFYAFLNKDGKYDKINEIAGFNSFRGERNSVANGITSSGDMIIGASSIEGDTKIKHAFVTYRMRDSSKNIINNYSQMFDLGTLCGNDRKCNSSANAISQNGDFIIGESDTTSGSSHAFVSSRERWYMDDNSNSTYGWTMTDLGTLRKNNLGNSTAYGIAGEDLIVGQSDTDEGIKQAFFSLRVDSEPGRSFSALKNLGSLKKDNTGESAATNAIQLGNEFIVSGFSDTDNGNKHAFIVKLRAVSDIWTPVEFPTLVGNPTTPPMITDFDSIIDPDLDIKLDPPEDTAPPVDT
ncbi:hypothetical protein ACEWQ7_004753, partial [Salmonella enterica]|nr:hypothetical protein [Salmonella enterica]